MRMVFCLSFVTATISFTISESRLILPAREWFKNKWPVFGNLISCGYCLGHWVALILVVIYRPRLFNYYWLLDYFLTILVIAWLSAIQWAIMCLLVQKAGK